MTASEWSVIMGSMGQINRIQLNRKKTIKKADFHRMVCGKKLPILTLDTRWHALFPEESKTAEIKMLENRLNSLLKKQGRLVNEVKDMKLLKKKLMGDIVSHMDTGKDTVAAERDKKMDKDRKYILEINDKVIRKTEELADIPYKIREANEELLEKSIEICYDSLKNSHDQISTITDWIEKTRVELKEKIIIKQDMETKNSSIYSYIHDLLGAELTEFMDDKNNM
jgi:hypothetical protein